jgi:hypothetical protein
VVKLILSLRELRTIRTRFMAGLGVVAALLLFCVQAGSAQPQPLKTTKTAAPIWTLAMDGLHVAYASGGRIHVWNVVTGATTVVKGNYSNAAHSVDAAELAIAGNRPAWTKRERFGNHEVSGRLYTASLAGSAHLISSSYVGNGRDSWIGTPVGAGKLLAVSTWRWDGSSFARRRLNLVTQSGLKPIAGGLGAIVSASSDGRRIAVVRSTAAWPTLPDDFTPPPPSTVPVVGIYSSTGALLREIDPSNVREIALSGNRLVVLTTTKTLEVYDATTGALVQTWPIALQYRTNSQSHLAVYGHLATYSVDTFSFPSRRLHLIDLNSGKDVVLAKSLAIATRDSALGPRGLAYVVDYYPRGRPAHGKLVFVPMARLHQLLG